MLVYVVHYVPRANEDPDGEGLDVLVVDVKLHLVLVPGDELALLALQNLIWTCARAITMTSDIIRSTYYYAGVTLERIP